MIIREFQLDKLEEARRLQQECLKLNLPSPPVLSWQYEIEANDNIVEKGIGKANSYTRNALNYLAWNVGLVSKDIRLSLFADGVISSKNTSGSIDSSANNLRRLNDSLYIAFGKGEAVENIDAFELTSRIAMANANVLSGFDSITRKLITTISRSYTNTDALAVILTQSGVYHMVTSYYLMIYDVFEPITVNSGETITWTYTTEVAFPNQ